MNSFPCSVLSIVLLLLSFSYAQNLNTLNPSLFKGMDPSIIKNQAYASGDMNLKNDADINRLLKDINERKNDGTNEKDPAMATNFSIDSLKDTTIKDASLYKKLINGEIIDPEKTIKSLNVFGYSIFQQKSPSTFAPGNNLSVPSDYVINIDDEIKVMLWGRINEDYSLKVQKNGSINIPRIGPVFVSGLNFETMRQNITDQISKIEGVKVTVSMGEMRTIGVYVIGEVKVPGFYTISALSNVTNALFASGGPTTSGSLRNIQLKRSGKTFSKIDFYDFLLSGNDNSSLRLQSGDVIFVPIVEKMAAIAGNVRRSAIYEIDKNTTLESIIKLAGGLSPGAWCNKIQISRFKENQFHVILDIDSISEKIPDLKIQDGDLISIFPVISREINAVYLNGNVIRPGKYEYKNDMKVSDIIHDYQDLLSETYFDYAVVFRQEPPSFLNRIIAFNLRNVIDDVNSDDNLFLKPKDQIMIYNKDFFEPLREVMINGAVTNPGKFKLMENMKVRDLILQAGGLNDEASPIRGELYRRHSSANEKIKTEKIDFCISCAMINDPNHNLPLYKGDVISIRNKMGWENKRTITLAGQINYPGDYVLFENENLGDLISRAGGFKEDAYVAAAVFKRQSVKELEIQRKEEYSKNLESDIMKLSVEKAAKEESDMNAILARKMVLKEEIDSSSTTGRVVIDLSDLKKYSDFQLEDGDNLFIPRRLNTVSVIGEVFNPTTFKFEPEHCSVEQMVLSAGGIKGNADKKNIYVIKANGSIITKKSNNFKKYELSPGDAVVVPQKIDYTNANKRFGETASAIANISSGIIAVIGIIGAISALQSNNRSSQ
jgi:protein involved in polysaccharide export with SLBB domain